MAHRQLSSLVRRIRRPPVLSSPAHYRLPQHPPDFPQSIAEDFRFSKFQSRFFSGSSSQRKAGGRVTNIPEKVVSSQGQSSGSQAAVNAGKPPQKQAETSNASEQSRLKYLLVIGALSALVVGLVSFFPWDLLRSYYVGEEKKPAVSVEDRKEINLEAEVKTHVQNDLKNPYIVQNQESLSVASEPQRETQDGEGAHRETTEHFKNSSKSAYRAEIESLSVNNGSTVARNGEKVSTALSEEKKTSETELKDEVSQLSGHLNDKLSENILPESLPDDSITKQSLAPSGKDEVLQVSHEQKESLGKEKDSVDDKKPKPMQAGSDSARHRPSLLDAYYLGARSSTTIQGNGQGIESKDDLSPDRHEGIDKYGKVKGEDSVNEVHTGSAQNAFDVLELVHAAEKRQAELDAHLYEEAQKMLKQAFQQELKNAQAREMMYAEEASRLAREIVFEKEKAAAALDLEQKMAKEKLLEELKRKEVETDLKLKKAELLSKTEIAAAIAEEKLSYIKDFKNVKQELEALHMVLSTQSEDFHQSHTVHKLAVGTFALEDAMKRGAPVEKEVTLISSSYRDPCSDPLLDAVISSFPEEAIKRGTLTPLQLQLKFDTLKTGILELSLIPSTGGGLLSHAAAKLVSAIKVKESGQYSDGAAAIVSQVQSCLAEGKLADAAEVLEKGVRGTKAETLVADWIKCVRDRAIMEQMLLLLQAHATATASSLA